AGIADLAEDDLHHGTGLVGPADRPRDRAGHPRRGDIPRLRDRPRRPRDGEWMTAGLRLVSGAFTGKRNDPCATVRGIARRHPTAVGDRLLARHVGRHPDVRHTGCLYTEEERPAADVDP